jgi:PAS domain S-box-containing protein
MPNDPENFDAADRIPLVHLEAVTDSEKLLAAYFSSSTVGLCILDDGLRYLAINATLAEINGIPAPDHLGRTMREVLGDFADVAEPELRQAFSTGKPVVNLEGSAVLGAGQEARHWVASSFPIKDEAGMVTRIAVVVVETTAQKKVEQSLKEVGGKLHKEMNRLQMLLDVSTILAANWNLHQAFLQIFARIRRVLRHEYAGFELHDPGTGLLVRQAEDFPLGKGLLSSLPISPDNSPGGRALQERTPLIFSRDQILGFEAEIARNFLAEGFQSLCCVRFSAPRTRLEFSFSAAPAKTRFSLRI